MLDHIIAQVYDPIMGRIEKAFLSAHRQYLLKHTKGNVLEIGAGTGANFSYYPKKIRVIALEPSAAMREKAEKNRLENITILPFGVGGEAWRQFQQENTINTIVCTLVLCTIPDVKSALKEFKKMLPEGGKLLVIEHIRSTKPGPAILQKIFTPLWKNIAGNCHLDRPTDQWIKEAGFELQEEVYWHGGVPWYRAIYSA